MTDWRLHPRGLDAAGLTDGVYVVNVVSGKVTGFITLPETGVVDVTQGTRMRVDNTDPLHPIVALASEQYVLTTVIDGTPALVWDETQLVYTEVSLP